MVCLTLAGPKQCKDLFVKAEITYFRSLISYISLCFNISVVACVFYCIKNFGYFVTVSKYSSMILPSYLILSLFWLILRRFRFFYQIYLSRRETISGLLFLPYILIFELLHLIIFIKIYRNIIILSYLLLNAANLIRILVLQILFFYFLIDCVHPRFFLFVFIVSLHNIKYNIKHFL